MNRFVKTALAIAVAGSAAQAGTGDNEWTALDSEISGLASSLKQSQDGSGWSALVRAVYTHSRDHISTGFDMDGVSASDTSGFNFNDIDLAFWGTQGPFSWRVSADLDGNGFEFLDDIDPATVGDQPGVVDGNAQLSLEDAYARWACGEFFDAMMGNFKPRVTRSNSVDPEKQLFIDRTAIGSAFDRWDMGVGVSGSWEETFHWSASLMNGLNGKERDHFYVIRGELDLGSGAGEYEGAMGSSDTLNATIGLSFVADDTLETVTVDPSGNGPDTPTNVNDDLSGPNFGTGSDTDNSAWILDLNGSVSGFGFGAEVADFDDEFVAFTDEDYGNIWDAGLNNAARTPFLVLAPDSMPWNVTASYLINPELEVGVRYEDLDNGDGDGADNDVLSVVANWYRGDSSRWQAQWTRIDAGSAKGERFNDGDVFEIGFAIGMTR